MTIKPYTAFSADEAAAVCAGGGGGKVLLERDTTTLAMAASLPQEQRELVDSSPLELLKVRHSFPWRFL